MKARTRSRTSSRAYPETPRSAISDVAAARMRSRVALPRAVLGSAVMNGVLRLATTWTDQSSLLVRWHHYGPNSPCCPATTGDLMHASCATATSATDQKPRVG